MKAVALIILDGWGIGPAWGGNAIAQAHLPFMNGLWRWPSVVLDAAGQAVGLPGNERGNSEVGHLNLGAGRVVIQDSTRIDEAIADGELARNQVLIQTFDRLQQTGKRLHLIGLLSRAAIHADTDHALALARLAHERGVQDIRIHLFMDGRDSGPRDGLGQIIDFENAVKPLGGTIQSIIGRYFAMDRDRHWDRTTQARNLIAFGGGTIVSSSRAAVSHGYAEGLTDEFIGPTLIQTSDGAYRGLKPGEAVLFWNFRADRARQLTEALTNNAPISGQTVPAIQFLSMTPYGAEHDLPHVTVVFQPKLLHRGLAEEISCQGGLQLHIAETEKYAHVTYFFNGGHEEPFPNEDRVLIPSPKVATFDLAPAMAAPAITDRLNRAIATRHYQFFVANYANADMVGHTGNFRASITAVETLDTQLRSIADTCAKNDVSLIITADHGNAEQMVDPKTGEPATDHTTNPVPCHILDPRPWKVTRTRGQLADVAPTILTLLDKVIPPEMTGQPLIQMGQP